MMHIEVVATVFSHTSEKVGRAAGFSNWFFSAVPYQHSTVRNAPRVA
jgi:hypothetical protein